MRIFYKIVVLCIIGASLFFLRADVKNAYDRVLYFVRYDLLHNTMPLVEDTTPAPKEPITSAGTTTASSHIPSANTPDTSTPAKSAPAPRQVQTPAPLDSTGSQYVFDSSEATATLSVKGVIDMTNYNRSVNGLLAPLKENAKLDQSAAMKLQDMFTNQYFEHVSPAGVGITNLADKVEYSYIVIGENLALGNFKDNKAVLDAWMNSPGHRANILNMKYTEIGVAVGRGMYQGHETWLAVQHFGLPQSACPAIDSALNATIVANEKELQDREKDLNTREQMIKTGTPYEGMTHDQQVQKYNQLVAEYNALIATVKQEIDTYNTEVNAYNACITANTSATHEE